MPDDVVVVEDGTEYVEQEYVIYEDEPVSEEPVSEEPVSEEPVSDEPVEVSEVGNEGASTAEETSPQVSEVMEVSLTDAQYANICSYMATQLYVSLSILIVVALCLGALLAQQVLGRWGVR